MSGNTGLFQIILIVAVILLASYAAFIKFRLLRQNMLMGDILKRITGEERDFTENEIKRLLSDFPRVIFNENNGESKILEEKTLDFMLENEPEMKIYLHYTMEESVARNIIAEGFKFVESFYRTAFPVSNDRLDLLMKHNDKKFYGDYVIVISISNRIVKKYSSALSKAGIKNQFLENILTETPPDKNENSDLVYLLPKQFIKGFINHRTGEIVSNPEFNPEYSSPGFKMNIVNLINL